VSRDPGLPRDPGPPRDPGLQPERTRLAWRRTVLAFTVIALLAARLASHRGVSPGAALAVAAAVGLWILALVASQPRIRAQATPRPAAAGRSLSLLASCALGYAVLGVVLVLLL
jgi:uncharacterized membrane protein YidH (DUF202 family)